LAARLRPWCTSNAIIVNANQPLGAPPPPPPDDDVELLDPLDELLELELLELLLEDDELELEDDELELLLEDELELLLLVSAFSKAMPACITPSATALVPDISNLPSAVKHTALLFTVLTKPLILN
jgi:hypothetical protein